MSEPDIYDEHHQQMVKDAMEERIKELETLVEAWKFDAGRQTGFLRKAEAKLVGVEDVVRKLYTDIRELYTTDNYDGGDFRRWLWMLEELLEVPRDQR